MIGSIFFPLFIGLEYYYDEISFMTKLDDTIANSIRIGRTDKSTVFVLKIMVVGVSHEYKKHENVERRSTYFL